MGIRTKLSSTRWFWLLLAASLLFLLAVWPVQAANAKIIVNNTGDGGDTDSVLPCDADTGTAGNQCTLRAAMQIANNQSGFDEIDFSIGSAGSIPTINVGTTLPTITQSVKIDGATSAAGFVEVHRVTAAGSGFTIDAGGVTINGLVINLFTISGINVLSGAKHTFTNNRIGTSKDGTLDMGNAGDGISLTNVDTATISNNLIAGNHGNGVYVITSSSITIASNLIGLNSANTNLPNDQDGVKIESSAKTTVGGASAAAGNIIGDNASAGIEATGSGSTLLTIRLNRIGLGSGTPNSTAEPNATGITLTTLSGATVRDNIISGNSNHGINLTTSNNDTLQGNTIGLDTTGTTAVGNGLAGIVASSTSSLTITSNIIAGNGTTGIAVTGTSLTGLNVEDNRVGVSGAAPGSAVPNVDGVRLSGVSGGQVKGNTVSGNSHDGLTLTNSSGVEIINNTIGLNPAGTAAMPNNVGVLLTGSSTGNFIGDLGFTNIISANTADGIRIDPIAHDNTVAYDFIGTNASNGVFGNGGAGLYTLAPGTKVIGDQFDANHDGIILDGATGTVVTASLFGTDSNGNIISNSLKNAQNGIYLTGSASGNTIGGTAAANRNIISKNGDGVLIEAPATNNVVEGNYIGTEADGDNHSLGQQSGNSTGVAISGPANTVQNNLVSNNNATGVNIFGSTGQNNVVSGNLIGTKADGTSPLGNNTGVDIGQGATDATVTGNTIANNRSYGLAVDEQSAGTTLRNYFAPNDFFNNLFNGINFGFAPSTPTQDHLDADNGPNGLQNAPIIVQANSDAIDWTLDSEANSTYEISTYQIGVCDSTGFGEGRLISEDFAGTVTTDANGHASGSTAVDVLLPGTIVTMTASRTVVSDQQATSMFSNCVTSIEAPTPSPSPSPTPLPSGQTPGPTPSPTPTHTPGPSQTATAAATATATATATPTSSPTATPASGRIEGDSDCNGLINQIDALAMLEISEGLASACDQITGEISNPDDTNCDGHIDGLDALDVLLHLATLSELPASSSCPAVGASLT